MVNRILFYTTAGCHLCEQAEVLLKSLGQPHDVNWQAVDIGEDEQLQQKYGIRIPVLRRTDTDRELGWPFDRNMLEEFLR